VWSVFVANGDGVDQASAVPVLGRLDGPASARALAMVAVFARSTEAARAATETLKLRDGRDVIGLLISLIRKPINYEVRPVNGPNMPGELYIDGERAITRRVYLPDQIARDLSRVPPRIFTGDVPFDPFGPQNLFLLAQSQNGAGMTAQVGSPSAPGHNRAVAVAPAAVNAQGQAARRDIEIGTRLTRIQQALAYGQEQLNNDVATLEALNAATSRGNDQVMPVLYALTGQDLGASPEDWKAWWADERGYVYDRPSVPRAKPVVTQVVPNPYQGPVVVHHSCFAAGTPVKTLEGPKPIEDVRVGDQVLAQDVKTGRLAYTPVVAVYHNKPAPTFRVKAAGVSIVATGIHRFWKAGHGWTMTRDLKPGDVLRTVGGTARVEAVDSDSVQPVYNLEVAESHSFFVGGPGLLVHDNGVVQPVSKPFDAPADLAALSVRGR
jgi:hypothetical protein